MQGGFQALGPCGTSLAMRGVYCIAQLRPVTTRTSRYDSLSTLVNKRDCGQAGPMPLESPVVLALRLARVLTRCKLLMRSIEQALP